MSSRRRARGATAKAARRDQILDAALTQYQRGPIADIALSRVAADAGVVKGTLYLYFPGKEALFLALVEREMDRWFDALDQALAGTRRFTGAGLADVFVSTVRGRPVLRRLLADLGPLIEPRVPHEAVVRFKWRLVGRLTAAGDLLERGAVFLRPGDGVRLLVHIQALIAGLHYPAEPLPEVRRALAAPGMESLRMGFDEEFRVAVHALLHGMERTN